MKQPRIGFIGTGVMGKSMAERIVEAGYPVNIHTRTYAKAESLLQMGAVWKEDVRSLAQDSDIVITMVGYPEDVESIYLGDEGLIHNSSQGDYLIDMTTSSPELAVQISEEGEQQGLYTLDAPVSGGDIGAKDGKLSIMVGGTKDAFNEVEFLFEHLGSNTVYQGPAGSGQFTKMCNQIAIASNMMGVSEALVYAERAGLEPHTVLKSISGGAAGSWSLTNLTPRVISGDFSPGFYVKHFIKDMKIAIDSAEKMNLELPGLKLARELYEKIAVDGEEDSGTQALYKYYQQLNSPV